MMPPRLVRFYVTGTRIFLGLIFFTAGMGKLVRGFPGFIGPVWLEEKLAPYGLGLFARFIAISQVCVGLLLLTRATTELQALAEPKQGKPRLDKRETRAAADQILARHRVTYLPAVQVKSHTTARAVRKYKDRPAGTRKDTTVTVTMTRQEDAITQVKEQLGWRVYATNHPDLTMSEAVPAYREQYRIEDGISRLKGRPLGLAPMYLQTESRMVGLIYFLTIALRVLTLVEFQVRRGLQAEGKTLTGIYAGQPGRQTARASTEILLAAFRGVDAAYGSGVLYLRPLTAVQKRILQLLELDEQLYEKLLLNLQNLAPG